MDFKHIDPEFIREQIPGAYILSVIKNIIEIKTKLRNEAHA